MPYAELGDPQTLNLYAYGRNNPVTQADADGHTPLDWIWEQSGYMDQQVGFGFHLWDGVRKDGPGNLHFRHGFKPQLCFCAESGPGPKSWAPGEPFPSDPSGLGPDWKLDPTHDPQGKSSDKRWVNGNGDKVDWHKGIPGASGWEGRDHWHWIPGGTKEKKHYRPGGTVKASAAGAVAGAVAGVAQTLIETAPEWGPIVAIAF